MAKNILTNESISQKLQLVLREHLENVDGIEHKSVYNFIRLGRKEKRNNRNMISFEVFVSMYRYFLTLGPSAFVLFMLLEGIIQHRPDIVDSENRVQSIHISELRTSYDFIVVGGGTAGCALAARLSEVQHWNILLLEAGGDEPAMADIPQLYPVFQGSYWDWKYKTEQSDRYCLAMKNQQCSWPRAKMLGGCSSINAMLYVRGNRKDYDHWAELGNVGWNYDNVLHYFRKLETMRIPQFERDPFHGQGGPVTVENYRFSSPLQDIFLLAAEQMNVVK